MSTSLSEHTLAKIQTILMRQLDVQRDQITPEAGLMADLGADSLDMVEIGMTVEEAFSVSLPDEAMETVRTVADLHDTLADLLERTGQPV